MLKNYSEEGVYWSVSDMDVNKIQGADSQQQKYITGTIVLTCGLLGLLFAGPSSNS